MNLFGFTITRTPPEPIRIVRGLVEKSELLSELELEEIFWKYPPPHPLFRALVQLIATAEDNANRDAATDWQDRDAHVGGAKQLRLLLDDIAIRQANALKRRGPPAPPPK